ncbi:MAG TPA: hypothetical protein VJN92_09965 [Candidatus Acidoferrum sp.]|nr:hypothetical protein [Candidatus Acidoferrum sp.]
MWIIKGTLLGLVIFIAGTIFWIGLAMVTAMIRLARIAKTGGVMPTQAAWDIRGIIHNPILWAVFLAAIGIGLWIVRARMNVQTV